MDSGPAQLPADSAARYEPATQPLEVGGDWYDVIRLPAGRIGIVVGDCVGHDLGAATIMGQLRSACRAVLLQNASPAQALAVLDQFAARIPGAMCSTAFCVILDPATGRFTYSSAGHPPGILLIRMAAPSYWKRAVHYPWPSSRAGAGPTQQDGSRPGPSCCSIPTGWSSGAATR